MRQCIFAMMVAVLASPLWGALASGQDAKGPPADKDAEAMLLTALRDQKQQGVLDVVKLVNALPAAKRQALAFRIRQDAVEFRFHGEFPQVNSSTEFLMSNANRDYESLLILDKKELARLKQVWAVVAQLTKAGQRPRLEFKLAWAEKSQPRVEDIEDIFRLEDPKWLRDNLKSLEWEDDGLRIDNTKLDRAALPAAKGPATMLLVIRPSFLGKSGK